MKAAAKPRIRDNRINRWRRSRVNGYFGAVLLFSCLLILLTPGLRTQDSMQPAIWRDLIYAMAGGSLVWWGGLWINRRWRFYRGWRFRPFRDNLLPVVLNSGLAGLGVTLLYVIRQGIYNGPIEFAVVDKLLLATLMFSALVSLTYRIPFVKALRNRVERHMSWLLQAEISAQLAALKAQLDPHFLANSITALCHLLENDPDLAKDFADDLAWVYQYVLDRGRSDLVELEDELEFVRRYFNLIQLRFGSRVQLRIAGSGIPEAHIRIPPLALQTLVENAIKHNPLDTPDPLRVDVSITSGSVTVSNPKRTESRVRKGEGFGLLNLERRVRLLTGRGVNITAGADVFAVTVPLVEAAE